MVVSKKKFTMGGAMAPACPPGSVPACSLARFMWSAVRELLGCGWNPTCFADVYREVRKCMGQTKWVLWTACAALAWTLWTTRNKFTIEGTLPTQAADGLYKLSMYM